jgi:hypothetical protein
VVPLDEEVPWDEEVPLEEEEEQPELGLLQGKQYEVQLLQKEQPMGEPPWGSFTEQGCPAGAAQAGPAPGRNWRRATDRDGPLRGSFPDNERPGISGPI